jgi:Domain of unknown function (DUF4398)
MPRDEVSRQDQNMMKTLFKWRPRYGMTVLPVVIPIASVFAASCASIPPPTEQVAVSTAAVAHAVSAGGPELAPMEMRTAREKLDRANVAMVAKDYERALSLAQEAQVDAQLAETKSLSSKAQKAASSLQEDSRALREEINRKASGPKQ